MCDGEPLYQQVYSDLERKITTGEIRYMERMPSLTALCQMYGVSSITIRRALTDLAKAGLVITRRGRGQGSFAAKRLCPTTVRTLLVAHFDIEKSPIEAYHEIFDLLNGIKDAVQGQDCVLEQVSATVFNHLPAVGAHTGYLIIGMNRADYDRGIEMARSHHAPFVLVNAPDPSAYPCTRVDMAQGAFLAVNYLAQLRHRRIAYMGPTTGEWFAPRYAGYGRALAANGLTLDTALIGESGAIGHEVHWRILDSLLALPDPPTAVFACSDYLAIHLLAHCKQRGIAVPQQLSICGYDDVSEAIHIEPALTTVRHPRREQGQAAVQLLAALVEEQKLESKQTLFEPVLVIRNSCALPRR